MADVQQLLVLHSEELKRLERRLQARFLRFVKLESEFQSGIPS